jgi:NCAIR mutase (PurE)-related protein
MDRKSVERLLRDLKEGRKSIGDVIEELRSLPYEDIGFAKPDTHRALRRDFPEVVYCPGKTDAQIVEVLKRLSKNSVTVLATRASRGNYLAVKAGLRSSKMAYHEKARIILIGRMPRKKGGKVLVITGGTSDIPVAEEAAVTSEAMGCRVERLYDVGVAGVHRLLDNRSKLEGADVLVVIAGMEGALPSVVSGLVDRPVIAVPTSVGYGASFDGLAALLAMMSSCSPGVAVVNIDNGFGAGYIAATIARPPTSR